MAPGTPPGACWRPISGGPGYRGSRETLKPLSVATGGLEIDFDFCGATSFAVPTYFGVFKTMIEENTGRQGKRKYDRTTAEMKKKRRAYKRRALGLGDYYQAKLARGEAVGGVKCALAK